ncbi:endonuclease domain-containing protein [Synechocystis salina LEGE 06155]|nr:endonuclease domain-containing protein [Synechocystis salina LEGE 06155]
MKDSHRIRGTTKEIEQAARLLRNNMTMAENILWEELRNRQILGFKFPRQHPVGSFIVDFYCPQLKLVIEVDGSIHDSRQEYDQCRSEKLKEFGHYVLRFTNNQVIDDLASVLETITQTT